MPGFVREQGGYWLDRPANLMKPRSRRSSHRSGMLAISPRSVCRLSAAMGGRPARSEGHLSELTRWSSRIRREGCVRMQIPNRPSCLWRLAATLAGLDRRVQPRWMPAWLTWMMGMVSAGDLISDAGQTWRADGRAYRKAALGGAASDGAILAPMPGQGHRGGRRGRRYRSPRVRSSSSSKR